MSKLGADWSNQTYANEREKLIPKYKGKNFKKYTKRYEKLGPLKKMRTAERGKAASRKITKR